MNEFEFFVGDRKVDHFILPLHKGKALLTCDVLERWEERTSRSLNCGMKRKRTLRKQIGISTTEREELESTISGSFGLEGIAGFKSELRGKLSREVSFEASREEEEEFEFEAPKCGRRIVRVYQLIRIYHLSFQDFRFHARFARLFGRGDLFKTVVEGVDRIYDRSIEIANDPDCGCDRNVKLEFDGLVNVALGKIAMLVGYKQTKQGVELPQLGLVAKTSSIHELLPMRIALPSRDIPLYLIFLANESSPVLNAQFFPERSLDVSEASHQSPHRLPGKSVADRLVDSLFWGSIGALAAVILLKQRRHGDLEQRTLDTTETQVQEKIAARRRLQRETLSSYAAETSTAETKAVYESEVE